tara:strand:+ start:51 stop:545 length:495 start_codon:yes stop_codon:yes gene_type:complete
MRAINIFNILFIIFLYGCSTVEIAKEVTKATKSVQTSINKIKSEPKNEKIIKQDNDIAKEKKSIKLEKEKEKVVTEKQKKVAKYNFLEKNLNEIIFKFGKPSLVRNDGNTKTVRYDTSNCRFFLYFDLLKENSNVSYYEIRNSLGNLIDKKNKISECFAEIKKA